MFYAGFARAKWRYHGGVAGQARYWIAALVVSGLTPAATSGCSSEGSGRSSAKGGGGNVGGAGGSGGEAPFVCPHPEPENPTTYVEAREPCADKNPLRNPYFGDLHVHTVLSFDAWGDNVRVTPRQAYGFARGQSMELPLSVTSTETRSFALDRPLDFAAVTDHAEFLGEVSVCTDPTHPDYDTQTCTDYRVPGAPGIQSLAQRLAQPNPNRPGELCGDEGCEPRAKSAWEMVLAATEEAYDRTSACSFTSFVAYEYTAVTGTSNLHRNVIFKTDRAPELPVSYFEANTPTKLWEQLDCQCRRGLDGCEVLAIPHNPNFSNGKMFLPQYPGAEGLEAQASAAELRQRLEPLVEIMQHKGSSECLPQSPGILGAVDELCSFEQSRIVQQECGDGEVGNLGMINAGCYSKNDFVRGALLTGLEEKQRLGVNPFKLGIISSTDTHMGTPGAVSEESYPGHTGAEAATAGRLGDISQPPSGVIGNPGGLVGVWAVENSRPALFEALARRETFGTSGPRIVPRFFGGWGLPGDLCEGADGVAAADAAGVPMGGTLPARAGDSAVPSFYVAADRDSADATAQLERAQVIKGWIDASGQAQIQVYEVAGESTGASVDEATCERQGSGADSLCAVWTDPDFDPALPAYYYVRVLETPSCRWSWRQCLALPAAERPESCTDAGGLGRSQQERAWTSPIWYTPR